MVGKRVAKLRAQHGESLRAAALRTGVSHTTIARIEKGEVTQSFHSTIKKIAAGYGVKVEYLLTGRDPKETFAALNLRLPAEERYKLSLANPQARIKLVLDFLMAEYAEEYSLAGLAKLLGLDEQRLRQHFDGGQDAGSEWGEVATALSRLTGISVHWFRWGTLDDGALNGIPPEAMGPYVEVVRKAARAGIRPEMLDMAIELLTRSRAPVPV